MHERANFSAMLEADLVLDGYRLLRPIGRGGFGEVWLCQVEATGEYRALKYLPSSNVDHLERELAALIRYRTEATRLQCPYLLPIEHVNRTDDGLFYSMQLADGLGVSDPRSPEWRPKTLAALIRERRGAPSWFSAREIQATIVPLATAAQALSDAGVAHRDIKPENILFVEGRPCLGDISLLTDGANVATSRGTPGYAAPRWYLESGGNPDMWGLASTLYSTATGNPPDKLGRASYLWPPQGAESVEKRIWNRFHRIIFQGTAEKPGDRFLDLDALADAIADATERKPLMIAGIRVKAAIRDMLIVWGLPGGVALVITAAGIKPSDPNLMYIFAVGNTVFGTIGYFIVGCLVHQSRWKHLLAVTVLVWLLDLTNLLAFGKFWMWLLCTPPTLLIWMAIGGGISSLIVRPREISKKRPKERVWKVETSLP
jgi:serine/threonine protein kinase